MFLHHRFWSKFVTTITAYGHCLLWLWDICTLPLHPRWWGKCYSTHKVEMLISRTRRKFWTKTKNGLYRNLYRWDKTFICPVANPEKITKPTESAQGEIETVHNLEESRKAGRLGKRSRRGSFLSNWASHWASHDWSHDYLPSHMTSHMTYPCIVTYYLVKPLVVFSPPSGLNTFVWILWPGV